jgi:hypothetical protein
MNEQKMTKKKPFMRACFLSFVFVVYHMSAVNCYSSEAYFPNGNIEIETINFDDDGNTILNRQAWMIKSYPTEDSSIRLEFLPIGIDIPTAICEIVIKKEALRKTIIWQGKEGQNELYGENGFLPVLGYPVPCDVLPVYQTEPEKEYLLYKKVGGTTFAERYIVKKEDTDPGSSIKNGWIKNEDDADSMDLMTITVYDNDKNLVVMQLWKKNSAWWLYEETPYRRSWRIK